nr:MAG TPA: 5-chloro-2-hydroxyhydroquinone dehydrochlorinase [Caudoviricetes sp.]
MVPVNSAFTRFPPLPTALMVVGGGGIFCCHHAGNSLRPGGIACRLKTMSYYAVEYVYNPSMTETMDEVRPTHRAFLSGLLEQGINVASGPLVGEIPGALILINAESQADVERILNEDPFYVAEVIQARLIREWNPVIRAF